MIDYKQTSENIERVIDCINKNIKTKGYIELSTIYTLCEIYRLNIDYILKIGNWNESRIS